MDPEFCVVIPVHNKERHVARAIQSVTAQTLEPAEIIIVDDASTDGSMDVVAALDVNARILRRDEPGPGGYAARNLAIEEARSPWIAFLDADDSWRADHLSSLAEPIFRAAGDDMGCAFSGYEFVEPDGRCALDWFTRAHEGGIFGAEDMLDYWLEGGCPLWTGAVAIQRQLLLEVGMFPAGKARRGGDRDLWLRTILETRCAFTGKVTATYHRDADNMVTSQEKFGVRQCLLDTIDDQLPCVAPTIAARLNRIANREIYQYVFKAWKNNEPIRSDMVDGMSFAASPLHYLAVLAMRSVPMPLTQTLRAKIRTLKRKVRRLT